MPDVVIGQILGIIATCLTFVSYQVNTKKWVLIIQTAATLFTSISYFFLQAMSGLLLNLVCIVRNVTFYFQDEKSKVNRISAVILALIMLVLGAISWQGWSSLLIITALCANTIFLSFGIPQLLRKSILFTSTLILVYNCLVFSIGGIVNESVAIVSSIVGIVRFGREKTQ